MTEEAANKWEVGPVLDWLVREGRFLRDPGELVRQTGQRLNVAGAPLWRLRLSMRTLHPLVAALSEVWERDDGSVEHVESAHGLDNLPEFLGSPLQIIGQTRRPVR